MPYAIVLAFILLSQSCTTTHFVAASDAEATTRSTQQLYMLYQGEAYEMLGVLETNAKRTSLAVLSPTGLLLFSVQQTNSLASTEKHPDMPAHLDPMRVLHDVQLINWPTDRLIQTLDSSTRLTETDTVRSLYRKDKQLKTVTFSPDTLHWQRAVLHDHELNYTLEVRLLSTELMVAESS